MDQEDDFLFYVRPVPDPTGNYPSVRGKPHILDDGEKVEDKTKKRGVEPPSTDWFQTFTSI